jgi:hypothetical protein
VNGPGHYREAERLAAQIESGAADWEPIAALAQVHATLAVAAATAMNDGSDGMDVSDWKGWRAVAHVEPEATS